MAETFGERLKRLATAEGLTTTALGALIGLSEGQVRRIYDGTVQSIKLDAAMVLCRRLRVSPWELAGQTAPAWDSRRPSIDDAETVSRSDIDDLKDQIGALSAGLAQVARLVEQEAVVKPPASQRKRRAS